jgi:chromosome segregation ATPase
MRPVRYFKSLLPLSFKRSVKNALMRSASIVTTLPALGSQMHAMTEEAEATKAALAELAHRTDYLKLNIEQIEIRLRDISDDLEALSSLKKKVVALEIDLANCRNLADVSFHAVEAIQFGRLRTGT